jgi:HlyD family secretion protein
VREGDSVKRDQVLISLEDRDDRARVEQARARLATVTARYQEAVAGARPETVREAEAELQRTVALRNGAADAVRNLEQQLETSTELKQATESARSQLSAAQASLQAAIARRDRERSGARPDAVREAEEAVAAAEATAERAVEEEARLHRAYERGAVARRDWDLAQTERSVTTAQLARARARLADLKAGARPEELEEAEQQVAAARAAEQGARTSLANARQLYRDRLPARQRLDSARSELRSAASAVAAARARLDLLQRGTRPEVIRSLRGQVHEARAALALAVTHQRDLLIRSPAAGVVTTRSVEPGEVIMPGARLLEIADPEKVWVRVYLPEKEYGRVRIGDRAAVTTDSLPDRVFSGRVRSIAQEAEYTPRAVQTKEERAGLMYAIRVDVENPPTSRASGGEGRSGATTGLRIGMPVDVRFP